MQYYVKLTDMGGTKIHSAHETLAEAIARKPADIGGLEAYSIVSSEGDKVQLLSEKTKGTL